MSPSVNTDRRCRCLMTVSVFVEKQIDEFVFIFLNIAAFYEMGERNRFFFKRLRLAMGEK